MFTTTFENFIAIGWIVCAPVREHRVHQLVQFLNLQNHGDHVYNNSRKFHRNQMNRMCSYKESATPSSTASTMFNFF